MKPSQEELLEIAKAELAAGVAALHFKGTKVTGKNGMVLANLKTRRLSFCRNPGDRPFCVFKIPKNNNSAALTKILTHPILRGWAALHFDKGMDDLTSVLLAFIISDRKEPVDLRSITLSPAGKILGRYAMSIDDLDGEILPEFEIETDLEKFDGPDYSPQYYKARPYNLYGKTHEGKMHALRYRSDVAVCTVTACGMQLVSCPGDLIKTTPEIEVNCKTCLAALKNLSWGRDVIDWRLRWYDGDEDRWEGFVQGEEFYGIHRGNWYALNNPSAGDSCNSLIDGFEICHRHLLEQLRATPNLSWQSPS